jgi:hypothetical protein
VAKKPFVIDPKRIDALALKLESLLNIARDRRACLTVSISGDPYEDKEYMSFDLHHKRRRGSSNVSIESSLDSFLKDLNWKIPNHTYDAKSLIEMFMRAAHANLDIVFKADFRRKTGKIFTTSSYNSKTWKNTSVQNADATASVAEVLGILGAI